MNRTTKRYKDRIKELQGYVQCAQDAIKKFQEKKEFLQDIIKRQEREEDSGNRERGGRKK